MNKSSTFLWICLIIIFLLPTAAGRIFLDIAGGLIFAALALPILLTGVGWIGWRFLQSRLKKCEFCGASVMTNSINCPVCGSMIFNKKSSEDSSSINNSIPASSATIDVVAKDSDNEKEII